MLRGKVAGSSNGGADAIGSRDLTLDNRRRVLQALLRSPVVSRVEISRDTGLAPASVYRLSRALIESGLAEEAGVDEATGGRPSRLLRFNPNARDILAVDVTPGRVEAATLNLVGEIVGRESVSVQGMSPQRSADFLVDYVAGRIRQSGPAPFASIGLSIPGPVTANGLVTVAPSLGWESLPLGERFAQRVAQPVTLENDMNLFAYAEWEVVHPAGDEAIVVLGAYHGIGVGIAEAGSIWRGSNGAAGQFGRMYMDVATFAKRAQDYRDFGQTEALLGSSALRRRAVERGLIEARDGTLDDVFLKAVGEDEAAEQFLDEVLTEYAFQIANLSAVVAPRAIVLAGFLDKWSDLVIPILEDKLEGAVLECPRLIPTALKEDAKLIGAGLYSLARRGGILALA